MTDPTTTVVYLVWLGSELHGVYGTVEGADVVRAALERQEAAEYGALALPTTVSTIEVR